MSILVDLERFLVTEIAVESGVTTLEPDENLLEKGVLDSLGLMKLTVYMEETFGIKVDDEDVVPDNFQTLSSMARLVEKKLSDK